MHSDTSPRMRLSALRSAEGVALVLIAGLLALRFLYVFTHAVDSDEPQNLHVIYRWLKGDLPYLDQFDNHVPLFHWLFLPLAALLGETPNIVPLARLALVPLSFGAVGLIYLLLRRIYDRRVALWSLVLTLALADWTLKSIEVRPDVLWMALWFAALCVLVRPEKRPGPWSFLLAGLLLGAAGMASVKTVFLLPALAFGWAGAWLLSREFRDAYPWRLIVQCALAGGVGLAVVPGIVAGAFAAQGALDEMLWCVYGINKDPFLSARSWIFPPGLLLALGLAAWMARAHGVRGAYRAAVFLAATSYTLAILSFGPYESLAKQTFLPAYPLLLAAACHLVLTLRAWSARETIALGGIATAALAVATMIGSPPFADGNARQRRLLTAVLANTTPQDSVMDMKGETIFRRRPVYMAYVGNTARKMEAGQIEMPKTPRLVATETGFAIERTSSFPGEMQNFLRDHYLSTTGGELRVAGKVLKPSWERDQWVDRTPVKIPGRYVIIENGQPVSEVTLSGGAGKETFEFADRAQRILFWKAAWDQGLRPSPDQ